MATISSRTFLKIRIIKSFSYKFQYKHYSQKLVQTKLLEIRSKIQQDKQDKTNQFAKENYLQRYNLTPSKVFIEKHPILLTDRSLTNIKDLLHLLHKRCGFNDIDALKKLYNKYPSIIELHPNDIISCLNTFKYLGFNQYEAFIRLEPSILLSTNSNDCVFINRLKLYKDILTEIGIQNPCKLLEKYCVHIIQKEPRLVLDTLKYYEELRINIFELIHKHPQCIIYSLNHIKKVIHFIHKNISDVENIDIKIIETCPHILGINLDKLKKILFWLDAVDLFKISEILNQSPNLLICNDVNKLDESYKCYINNYKISKSIIRNNLWLLLIKQDSINKRMNIIKEFDVAIDDENISLLKFDSNSLKKLLQKQLR